MPLPVAHARAQQGPEPGPGFAHLHHLQPAQQAPARRSSPHELPQADALQEQRLPVLHLQAGVPIPEGLPIPHGDPLQAGGEREQYGRGQCAA